MPRRTASRGERAHSSPPPRTLHGLRDTRSAAPYTDCQPRIGRAQVCLRPERRPVRSGTRTASGSIALRPTRRTRVSTISTARTCLATNASTLYEIAIRSSRVRTSSPPCSSRTSEHSDLVRALVEPPPGSGCTPCCAPDRGGHRAHPHAAAHSRCARREACRRAPTATPPNTNNPVTTSVTWSDSLLFTWRPRRSAASDKPETSAADAGSSGRS